MLTKIIHKRSLLSCLVLYFFSFSLGFSANAVTDTLIVEDSLMKDTLMNSIFDELYGLEIREVRLKTDIQQLLENRRTNNWVEGQFHYTNEEVKEKRSVKVQVRGKTRRRVCDFPPLRLRFNKKELKKDQLAKFKSLKLVTHCLDSENGSQNLLKEYLAYKIYNKITDLSFRVQLLKITYVDSKDKNATFEQYGFIIEDDDELAKYNNCETVEGAYNTPLSEFDSIHYLRLAIFQYMIGNTDWYINMVHNIKLISPLSSTQKMIIPYDFDSSGLVNAPYAKPNPNFNQRTVRQRVFMGECNDMALLVKALECFKTHKEDLLNLTDSITSLSKKQKKKCRKYLNQFYETIENPKRLKSVFVKQ